MSNRPIIERLMAARDARKAAGLPAAKLTWVRGHSGHRLNGWADQVATAAATRVRADRTLDRASWGSASLPLIDVSADAPTSGEDRARRGGRKGGRRGGRSEFGNQGAVGERLGGLSAVEVGHRLESAGLRDPHTKLPTQAALDAGVGKIGHLKNARAYGQWHLERTPEMLRQADAPGSL